MRVSIPCIALTLSLSVLLGACSSSTELPATPEGLTVTESGVPVIQVTGNTVNGSFRIDVDRSTPPVVVTFTDSEGTSVKTNGRYLDVAVGDEAIATFEVTDASGFTGRLTGKEAGNTTIRFMLMEGAVGSGTLVYESPLIPVRVEGMV
jgi:hypothetical protein